MDRLITQQPKQILQPTSFLKESKDRVLQKAGKVGTSTCQNGAAILQLCRRTPHNVDQEPIPSAILKGLNYRLMGLPSEYQAMVCYCAL